MRVRSEKIDVFVKLEKKIGEDDMKKVWKTPRIKFCVPLPFVEWGFFKGFKCRLIDVLQSWCGI